MPSAQPAPVTIAIARIVLGVATVAVLLHTYLIGIPRQGANAFDYFGYFTNLTSLLTSLILIVAGMTTLQGRRVSELLMSCRAVAVACLLIVGLVYNLIVPGTGSAPAWVSAFLHTVLPLLVLADWALVGDRRPLPWRSLWIVLPYPLLWITVVLVRGATDGWVPYGFLLPEQGPVSLAAHVGGLLVALLAAGAVVWTLSRFRGLPKPRDGQTVQP